MKERPILFSAPMVRAILEGRKTQTRRVIKPQPMPALPSTPTPIDEVKKILGKMVKSGRPYIATEGKATGHALPGSPYGKSGDRLWVRETFNTDWADDGPIYRADGGSAIEAGYSREPRWKPSIFMPRKYSRITLEITGMRVERLQDISEDDARMEGGPNVLGFVEGKKVYGHENYRAWFKSLWESINGAESWAENPWVWVVEFKRVNK